MLSDLKNKLPHIYAFFIHEHQAFKAKHPEDASDFGDLWNQLIAKEEQLVKTVIVFIKLIDARLAKADFTKELHQNKQVLFTLPPVLQQSAKNQTLLEAIFEDVKLQSTRVIKRSGVEDILLYHWQLASGEDAGFLFILDEMKDSLLIESGIKDYLQAKEDRQKQQQAAAAPQPEENRYLKYANELFESVRLFEQDVLQVATKEEKRYLMREVFKEIVFNTSAKQKLNFAYLDNYDNFQFSSVVEYIAAVLREEVEYYLSNIPNMPPEIVHDVIESAKRFLQSLALSFEERYGELLKEIIADSFLECVAAAESMPKIPKIIQEAITGTRKYKPILEITKGNSVATKADMMWMRLRQAKLARDKALAEEQKSVDYYEKKVTGMKKNLIAIRNASKLTLAAIKKFTPQDVCDIALNEDGSRTEDKRLIQFVPKGDLTLELIDKADRARRGGKTAMQKEDGKNALKFYNNLHINNTENVLKEKIRSYNEELPVYEEKLQKAIDRLEEVEEHGIEMFDDSLKAMKDALIKNLGKKREY